MHAHKKVSSEPSYHIQINPGAFIFQPFFHPHYTQLYSIFASSYHSQLFSYREFTMSSIDINSD